MTCASCAARIEKKLNRMDGVVATVNYATETATRRPRRPASSAAELVGSSRRPATTRDRPAAGGDRTTARRADARRRSSCAAGSSSRRRWPCRCSLLSMVPALHVRRLAAGSRSRWPLPVVTWGAWPFHRAAWIERPARRRDDGHPGQRSASCVALRLVALVGWWLRRGRATSRSPPVVTVFLLAGRYAEARARRSSGAALRALLDLGAKDVAVPARTASRCGSRSATLAVGDRVRRAARGEVATDGVVVDGTQRRRRVDAHRRAGPGRGRPGRRRRRRHGERRRPARRCAPPGSAPTPSSPRWPGWSSRRRAARPPCSGWPTGSRRCSCRVVLVLAVADASSAGCWPAARRPARSPPRSSVLIIACPCALGPGHADGPAGRHRPRRPARHPDQGPAGARVHPPGRHRRAGQDRHRHHRPDERPGRRRRPRVGPRRRAAAGRRRRARLGAPDRPGDRRGRGAGRRRAAGRHGLPQPATGSACRPSSTAATVRVGRRSWLEPDGVAVTARAARCGRPRPSSRAARSSGSPGTAQSRGLRGRRRRGQADLRRRPCSALRQLGLRPFLLTGDNRPDGRGRRRAGRHRRGRRGRRGAARRTRSPWSSACRPRGRSSRWSATA